MYDAAAFCVFVILAPSVPWVLLGPVMCNYIHCAVQLHLQAVYFTAHSVGDLSIG